MWLKSGYRRRPKDESAPQIFCSNDLTIPAFSSRRSRGCSIPKPAQRPRTAGRPLLTMGVSPDSGSNVPVTCRSTRSHVERQLLHPTSSHNRPKTAVGDSRKRPVSQNQVLRTGLLRSCHWRTHPIGHYLPLVVTSGLFAFDRTEWQVSGDQIDR